MHHPFIGTVAIIVLSATQRRVILCKGSLFLFTSESGPPSQPPSPARAPATANVTPRKPPASGTATPYTAATAATAATAQSTFTSVTSASVNISKEASEQRKWYLRSVAASKAFVKWLFFQCVAAGRWLLFTLKQLLFFHSGKLVLVTGFGVALFDADVMGLVLVITAVWFALETTLSCVCCRGRLKKFLPTHSSGGGDPLEDTWAIVRHTSFSHVWKPFYIIAVLFFLAKFVFQADAFNDTLHTGWYTGGPSAAWWGFHRSDIKFAPNTTTLVTSAHLSYVGSWKVFRAPIILIMACALLRWSKDFEADIKTQYTNDVIALQASGLEELVPGYGLSLGRNPFDALPLHKKRTVPLWTRANLVFVAYYPALLSDASLVLLLITALTHLDTWSIFISVVVGVCMRNAVAVCGVVVAMTQSGVLVVGLSSPVWRCVPLTAQRLL